MTNPRVHDGLQTPDGDRSPAFTAGMFERKPEESLCMDSTMITVGEDTGPQNMILLIPGSICAAHAHIPSEELPRP